MSALPKLPDPAVNPQKTRKGLDRVWHATLISLHGLRAGWSEPAFRQEAVMAIVMIPASFWLGSGWVEVALLAGSAILVMIIESLLGLPGVTRPESRAAKGRSDGKIRK